MPNNIFIGPNSVGAKQTATFDAIGFNNTNVEIVFEIGNSLKSWVPGRTINSINGIVADKGYYIVSKVDADLTAYFDPDFLENVPSERTLTINGVTFDLSANRTWTIEAGGENPFTSDEVTILKQLVLTMITGNP